VAQPAPVIEKPTISVLVAARDLPTGSFIRPEDLRWQTWPEGQIAETYLLKDKDTPEALSGAVVRLRIVAGEPITNNRVIKPGDRGFLAAVLTPGMRAVAVPVTPISGVAGLVFPGDHVDVILQHQVRSEALNAANQPSITAFASETVLTDLRILAIDQSTADIEGKPVLAKTVTFEVTPKQVEVIEVAGALGSLYLSQRSIVSSNVDADGVTIAEDEGPAHGVRSVSYTWDSDVSALIHHGPTVRAPTVTILRGGKGGNSANVAAPAPVDAPNGGAAPTPPASSK
jgi:pilus assembly protein CpaB